MSPQPSVRAVRLGLAGAVVCLALALPAVLRGNQGQAAPAADESACTRDKPAEQLLMHPRHHCAMCHQ